MNIGPVSCIDVTSYQQGPKAGPPHLSGAEPDKRVFTAPPGGARVRRVSTHPDPS